MADRFGTFSRDSAISAILAEFERVRGSDSPADLCFEPTGRDQRTNQFCLFLKPWTLRRGADLREVLNLVFERSAAHGLAVGEAAVLPGPYLAANGIMARHYWRMEAFARAGAAAFTPAIRARFEAAFGPEADPAAIMGGWEFLERYADVSPFALELLWENLRQERLGNSVSCGRVRVGTGVNFVVNGFVPNLLATYGRSDSLILVLALTGPLRWSDARRRYVGATDPAAAAPGSLRNELFRRREALGIDIRLGANGVHLSAGPLEAVTELRRLLPPRRADELRPIEDFQFGRKLVAAFGREAAAALLANPIVGQGDDPSELFDLTEGLDEEAALERLRTLVDPAGGQAAACDDSLGT